eukprot:TRINITY_DN25431_c0_g1_i1.p1 TRINITY_DN25431_c0_g1~~TRINITY_DN25431_c0_g1_i1.p1  ORF type:complete len:122 (-),score=14.81 TRINITY_DN25431_c0_g1_i1:1743-2108(-)
MGTSLHFNPFCFAVVFARGFSHFNEMHDQCWAPLGFLLQIWMLWRESTAETVEPEFRLMPFPEQTSCLAFEMRLAETHAQSQKIGCAKKSHMTQEGLLTESGGHTCADDTPVFVSKSVIHA